MALGISIERNLVIGLSFEENIAVTADILGELLIWRAGERVLVPFEVVYGGVDGLVDLGVHKVEICGLVRGPCLVELETFPKARKGRYSNGGRLGEGGQ